jgi:adenylosuccinate synthase
MDNDNLLNDDLLKHMRFFKDDRERIKAMPELPPEALTYIKHLEEAARRGAALHWAMIKGNQNTIRAAEHRLADELEFLDFLTPEEQS